MRTDDSSTRSDIIMFENGNHNRSDRLQSIGTDDSDEYRKLKIRFQISAKFFYLKMEFLASFQDLQRIEREYEDEIKKLETNSLASKEKDDDETIVENKVDKQNESKSNRTPHPTIVRHRSNEYEQRRNNVRFYAKLIN